MKPKHEIRADDTGIEWALDQVLADEEDLIPSSGFAGAVMERVRDEAIAPRPIPFPWKRALPGIVLAASVLGWLIVEFIRATLTERTSFSISSIPARVPAISPQAASPMLWIGIAAAVSLASWIFAKRLARGARLF